MNEITWVLKLFWPVQPLGGKQNKPSFPWTLLLPGVEVVLPLRPETTIMRYWSKIVWECHLQWFIVHFCTQCKKNGSEKLRCWQRWPAARGTLESNPQIPWVPWNPVWEPLFQGLKLCEGLHITLGLHGKKTLHCGNSEPVKDLKSLSWTTSIRFDHMPRQLGCTQEPHEEFSSYEGNIDITAMNLRGCKHAIWTRFIFSFTQSNRTTYNSP